jgi:hypothetical protein
MVFNSGMPIRFWGDAVKYAAYVLNRSPSRSNPGRNSLLELLECKTPSLLNVVVFGSTCMVYRDSNDRTFKKRATRGTILGVPEETKGYVVYLKVDNKVISTQHVKYIENLSRAQNASLLAAPPMEDDTSNARNGGAVTSEGQPGNRTTVSRISTRTAEQRKPSRILKDALAPSVSAPDEESLVCNFSLGDP